MAISKNKAIQKDDSTILLICALAVTLLLLFIDEGKLTFNWMSNVGSWIVFIIYAVFIFMGEIFMSNVVLKKHHGITQTILSITTGSGLGILFVLYVVFRNW